MCFVIRTHLDTCFFPVGVDEGGVCAGTPNNASMVTVYPPAWTTVVVCAGTPRNKLRVTIQCTGEDGGGGVRRRTTRKYL